LVVSAAFIRVGYTTHDGFEGGHPALVLPTDERVFSKKAERWFGKYVFARSSTKAGVNSSVAEAVRNISAALASAFGLGELGSWHFLDHQVHMVLIS
jgi:hypothetical protein